MTESMLLPSSWDLPQVFRERLGREAGRQRAMYADGHLLVILHGPPKPGDSRRAGRFFWRNPEGYWKSVTERGAVKSLETHIEDYEAAVDRLESREHEAASAARYLEVLDALTPLHRSARLPA